MSTFLFVGGGEAGNPAMIVQVYNGIRNPLYFMQMNPIVSNFCHSDGEKTKSTFLL